MEKNKPNQDKEPKLKSRELSESQRKILEMCDEILALQPDRQLTFVNVEVNSDPEEVDVKLRASGISDVMLQDGESLSVSNPDDYHPDLNLYIGSSEVVDTGLRSWGWDFDDGSWMRELDISLVHTNGEKDAQQVVKLVASSSRDTPQIIRDVWAFEYAETGYEGHNQKYRSCSDEEAEEFLDIARQMLDAKKLEKQMTKQEAAETSAKVRELCDPKLTFKLEKVRGAESEVARKIFDIPDPTRLDDKLKTSPVSDLLIQNTQSRAKKDRMLKERMVDYAPYVSRLVVSGSQTKGSEYWGRRIEFNLRYKHEDDESDDLGEVRQIIGLHIHGGPSGNRHYAIRYDDEIKDETPVRGWSSEHRSAGTEDVDFLLELAKDVMEQEE